MIGRRVWAVAACICLSTVASAVSLLRAQAPPAAAVSTPVTFERDILPVMAATCLNCHGEDVQLGKLDLRTRESALRGGEHGTAIVPGKAEQSRLFRMIAGLDDPAMPLGLDPLTPGQIAAFRAWIDQGAPWSPGVATAVGSPGVNPLAALETMTITPEQRDYWAFKLPVQKAPPVVTAPAFSNPIDRFLERDRAARGLTRAPRADKTTLVRRAYLDLLGLSPTPAQVDAFVSDRAPQAWERLIDRLLASPHYGERYGRHWLDVARYADSAGFEYDMDRPNAWRYRDYVIKAFNDDKPYTQFITEQLAGDELDDRTHETLIATGFLRAGPRVLFREKDNPERRFDYLDEILGTIGKGMLGVTVNCARCHNHKFDPIPQKDYYALQASIFGYVETDVPLAPRAEAEAYLAKNAEIDATLGTLKAEIAAIEKPVRDRLELEQIRVKFPAHVYNAAAKADAERTAGEKLLAAQIFAAVNASAADIDQALDADTAARKKVLVDRMKALEKERPPRMPMIEVATDGDHRFAPLGEGDNVVSCPKCRIPPPIAGSYIHGDGKYEVPPSYFLIRGDPESRGSPMKPGFLTVATYGEHPTEIPRPDGNTSGRRLALAQWIASPQNPLTARVIVNRLWQKHFGRGIVATLENFGKMGEQPTHPDLLDWLAVEFMNRGWSMKQINKLMMMSEAYQMASAFEHPANAKADGENRYLWRFRPQRLEAEIVRDAMLAAGGNINLALGGEPIFPFIPADVLAGQYRGKWVNTPEGPAAWRRGVYVYRRRSLPYPMFDTFDHPDMNTTAGARNVTTVPTQALTLLNNPFVLAQARMFAERVRQEAADPYTQIDRAYRIALSRPPTETEIRIGLDLIKQHSLESFTHVVLNLDEFLYMR